MSLRSDRREFDAAYTSRSERRLLHFGDSGPDVLIVAASAEHGGQVAELFDTVAVRKQASTSDTSLPAHVKRQAGELTLERVTGSYKGRRITAIHTGFTAGAFGSTYLDL